MATKVVNPNPRDLVFRNARLIYRNFAGREDKYNKTGLRSFCVVLDPEQAEALENEGWNIRWPEPREDGTVLDPYMNVTVSYKLYKPKVVLIGDTTENRVFLDEEDLDQLDWVEIAKCDFIVDPNVWEVGPKSGIKAYLKKIFITFIEDELEIEYGQDSSSNDYFEPEED